VLEKYNLLVVEEAAVVLEPVSEGPAVVDDCEVDDCVGELEVVESAVELGGLEVVEEPAGMVELLLGGLSCLLAI
jgi:hypothetical protein